MSAPTTPCAAQMRRVTQVMHLEPVASSVGIARWEARRQLGAWGMEDLFGVAELIVSELVTNAVMVTLGGSLAGGTPVIPEVRCTLSASAKRLRVEVWDCSPDEPVRKIADVLDESGRGLELVDMLSEDWGWSLIPAGGKIVWAELLA